jgi:hypothetical protein
MSTKDETHLNELKHPRLNFEKTLPPELPTKTIEE